jgi:hypothetical protein
VHDDNEHDVLPTHRYREVEVEVEVAQVVKRKEALLRKAF